MTKSFSPDIFRNFDELLGKYWLGRWQTRAEICQSEKKEPEKNRTSKKQNQVKPEPAKNGTSKKTEPAKKQNQQKNRTSKKQNQVKPKPAKKQSQ